MDNEQFKIWQDSVLEHCQAMVSLQKDEGAIKKLIIDHLKQFFTWKDIEFSEDINKITLYFENDPVIHSDKLSELHMDWIISAYDYDDVRIELYPFGLPKEGEIVWD